MRTTQTRSADERVIHAMVHAAEHLADAAYAPAKMAVMTRKELDEFPPASFRRRAFVEGP